MINKLIFYGLIVCHDGRVIKYGFDFDKVKTKDDLDSFVSSYNFKYDKNIEDTNVFIKKYKEDFNDLGIYIEILGEQYEKYISKTNKRIRMGY